MPKRTAPRRSAPKKPPRHLKGYASSSPPVGAQEAASLPRQIILGGVRYRIRVVSPEYIQENLGHDAWGYCDIEKDEIVLVKGMKADHQWAVLVHEMLHAIIDASGICVTLLGNSKPREERLVHAIAPFLAGVLRLR